MRKCSRTGHILVYGIGYITGDIFFVIKLVVEFVIGFVIELVIELVMEFWL